MVECFRKLAIVCMPVFFTMGSAPQLIFGLVVCFLTYGIYSLVEPYEDKADTYLALLAQAQIFFSLISSISLNFQRLSPTSEDNIDILLTILLTTPFVIGLLMAPLEICGWSFYTTPLDLMKHAEKRHDALEKMKSVRARDISSKLANGIAETFNIAPGESAADAEREEIKSALDTPGSSAGGSREKPPSSRSSTRRASADTESADAELAAQRKADGIVAAAQARADEIIAQAESNRAQMLAAVAGATQDEELATKEVAQPQSAAGEPGNLSTIGSELAHMVLDAASASASEDCKMTSIPSSPITKQMLRKQHTENVLQEKKKQLAQAQAQAAHSLALAQQVRAEVAARSTGERPLDA